MRFTSLPRPVAATLLALPLAAGAFTGDFAITDPSSPAGFYNVFSFDAGTTPTLGQWTAGFSPSVGGNSFIDTTHAPTIVTFGSATPLTAGFAESGTVFEIDIATDGFLSFTVWACNSGEGEASFAGFEVLLSGEGFYSPAAPMTNPGEETRAFIVEVAAGQTLRFRSYSISGDDAYASNLTTISDFIFSTSPIPEPATFGALLGLAALGFAGRRRRVAASAV
jgi:hypothetical protein